MPKVTVCQWCKKLSCYCCPECGRNVASQDHKPSCSLTKSTGREVETVRPKVLKKPPPKVSPQEVPDGKPVICKACEGTGRSSSNRTCTPCDGTGRKQVQKFK